MPTTTRTTTPPGQGGIDTLDPVRPAGDICILLSREDAERHCEQIRDVQGAYLQAAEYEQRRHQEQRAIGYYCRAESMRELLEAIEYGLVMDAPTAEAEAVMI